MRSTWPCLLIVILFLETATLAGEHVIKVTDDASLRAALRSARPGTRVQIAPGRYQPEVYVHSLAGTAAEPIVIEGTDPQDPPLFAGGGLRGDRMEIVAGARRVPPPE